MASTNLQEGTSPTTIVWMSIIAVLLCAIYPGGAIAGLILAALALLLTRISPRLRSQFGLWLSPSIALLVAAAVCILTIIHWQ